MSSLTGAPQDPVRDFYDWKFHARECYENLTMFVLPEHTVSLNFTSETVCTKDSYIFGLVLGNTLKDDNNSTVSLYNSIFPNQNSISFNKSKPNKNWGNMNHKFSFDIKGKLTASTINSRNDIIAGYDNKLIYITENQDFIHEFESDDQITLIQPSPESSSTSSFICTLKNPKVFFSEDPSKTPLEVSEFNRPIIDMSIDPFQSKTALCTEGKNHVHLIDQRTSENNSIKLNGFTSSISFSPFVPFLFANGLLSGDVALFDLRSPTAPLCDIQAHESEISALKWSPFRKDFIASTSLDTSIAIWSLTDTKDLNSTAAFVHSGHVSPITAFDWCRDVPWTLASVSEDNLLEIWTIAASQYEDFLF